MITGASYVFVSTPKVGTTAMYQYLMKSWGGVRYGDFHETVLPEGAEHKVVFTTCRDPYDRAVSMWWHTCHRGARDPIQGFHGLPLEAFLKRLPLGLRWTQPQASWHDRFSPSYVLRLETLDADFAALPFVRRPVHIPPRNRSEVEGLDIDERRWTDRLPPPLATRPAHVYFTTAARQLVQARFAADFERYGYPT